MSQKINILTIKNENTGNQLKAGDHTILKYQLTDGNNEVLTLEGLPARVSLLKDKQILYQTETTVGEENRVQFSINEVLAAGTYILEIIVDDQYIFPSSTEEKLYIVSSSKNIKEELLHSYGIEQLKQEIEESCRSLIVEKQVLSPSTDEELEKMKNDFEALKAQIQVVNYAEGSSKLAVKKVTTQTERIEKDMIKSFFISSYDALDLMFFSIDFVSKNGQPNVLQPIFLSSFHFGRRATSAKTIYLIDEEKTIHALRLALYYERISEPASFGPSDLTKGRNGNVYSIKFLDEVPFNIAAFDAYMLSKEIQ